MITSEKQAKAVQARREAAGKKGIAKAVQRFNEKQRKQGKQAATK